MADEPFFQRLQDWQDLKGMKDGPLADMLGCDRSGISRAKRGIHALKMRHKLALEALSGIKPSEWAEFEAEVEVFRAAQKPKSKKKLAGEVA